MPMFFVPLTQFVAYPAGDMLERVEVRSHFVSGLMLTTNATSGALELVVTKILADVDPNLTITSVRTMREQVAVGRPGSRGSQAVLFGGVALMLAAVGLSGVTAYGVAQRRNEDRDRVALGAATAAGWSGWCCSDSSRGRRAGIGSAAGDRSRAVTSGTVVRR